MTTQRLALTGGYPDGVWTCAWCAAALTDDGISHREDCAWIAEVKAAERERCAQLAEQRATEISDVGVAAIFGMFAAHLRRQP